MPERTLAEMFNDYYIRRMEDAVPDTTLGIDYYWPRWINRDSILNEQDLHSNYPNCNNTMTIATVMGIARIRTLDDRNAAHVYARLKMYEQQYGGKVMDTREDTSRRARAEDVFLRLGLVNTQVGEGEQPLPWGTFVMRAFGATWESEQRRVFRNYMRDVQGGH